MNDSSISAQPLENREKNSTQIREAKNQKIFPRRAEEKENGTRKNIWDNTEDVILRTTDQIPRGNNISRHISHHDEVIVHQPPQNPNRADGFMHDNVRVEQHEDNRYLLPEKCERNCFIVFCKGIFCCT
ncbi:hypothetical protein JTB14_029728 [Gonioctena quinquepunctata]|nr:hypothetical protein JTB14_029728 [Gonioctena quinquepunctata]